MRVSYILRMKVQITMFICNWRTVGGIAHLEKVTQINRKYFNNERYNDK